jgi:hypothetical protein
LEVFLGEQLPADVVEELIPRQPSPGGAVQQVRQFGAGEGAVAQVDQEIKDGLVGNLHAHFLRLFGQEQGLNEPLVRGIAGDAGIHDLSPLRLQRLTRPLGSPVAFHGLIDDLIQVGDGQHVLAAQGGEFVLIQASPLPGDDRLHLAADAGVRPEPLQHDVADREDENAQHADDDQQSPLAFAKYIERASHGESIALRSVQKRGRCFSRADLTTSLGGE